MNGKYCVSLKKYNKILYVRTEREINQVMVIIACQTTFYLIS